MASADIALVCGLNLFQRLIFLKELATIHNNFPFSNFF